MILVVHAHPYPRRSRATAALAEALRPLPQLEMRSLYELYPDFDIDAAAEQQALARAHLVVWLHPIYWYTAPALMKLWFEKVLTEGWAFGAGRALEGKACLWAVTTGGDEDAYSDGGRHAHPFTAFAPVVEQTARYCGMRWLEPFRADGSRHVPDEAIRASAAALRQRVDAWLAETARA